MPVVLVGNKIDRVHEREVETRHGEELAKRLGCAFIETSAKTRVNLEEAYFMAVRMSASLSLFFLTPSESTQLLTLLGACPQSRLGKAARRPSPCGRRPRSSGNARSFERARLASPRLAHPLHPYRPPMSIHAQPRPSPFLTSSSPRRCMSRPSLSSSSPRRPLVLSWSSSVARRRSSSPIPCTARSLALAPSLYLSAPCERKAEDARAVHEALSKGDVRSLNDFAGSGCLCRALYRAYSSRTCARTCEDKKESAEELSSSQLSRPTATRRRDREKVQVAKESRTSTSRGRMRQRVRRGRGSEEGGRGTRERRRGTVRVHEGFSGRRGVDERLLWARWT